MSTRSKETIAAQVAHYIDTNTGAVVPPIHTSTTFARNAHYQLPGPHEYARDDNPTFLIPEKLLAELEGGHEALLFSSGMAAATTAVNALVKPGGRIVVPRAMYQGLRLWLADHGTTANIDIVTVDQTDLDAVRMAITAAPTALVWVETPANPTWDIVDIEEISKLAHAHGARVVVDSTVATPVHTQPLALGADFVMHAATKSLNGHSDVLAGALVCGKDDADWQRMRWLRHFAGSVLGPFEAFLLLRGMRTLYVRMARASQTALVLATSLESNPAVERVLYPGLVTHRGHDIAAKQMKDGYGAMLSVLVRGDAQAALGVAGRLEVFLRATSLGGVESLVEHRLTVEGAGSLAPANLLRLSIGLESADDLLADLEAALGG